jgi:hypothetical protein
MNVLFAEYSLRIVNLFQQLFTAIRFDSQKISFETKRILKKKYSINSLLNIPFESDRIHVLAHVHVFVTVGVLVHVHT